MTFSSAQVARDDPCTFTSTTLLKKGSINQDVLIRGT